MAVIAVACCLYVVARAVQSGLDARAGRADLAHAAVALRTQHTGQARADLLAAGGHFRDAHDALHAMGPLLPVVKVVPLVRIQVRGLETMADVGGLLSSAGLHLTTASDRLLAAKQSDGSLADALPELRAVQGAMHDTVGVLSEARRRTAELDGYRLLGPLGTTRRRLETELVSAEHRAAGADNGMRLLLWLIGSDRPHRLLVFSQNPDEPRPTGGFLGTYGVVEGDAGHVRLDRYGDILKWVKAHPQIGVKPTASPTAFHFASPPEAQGLANVNATPDWPAAADLAMRLWSEAGEKPVDGAFSLMPQTMARIVGVLGPIQMPAYGETVTAANLVARLNFYTHREAVRHNTNRKQFIVDLAHVVVQRVIDAPSTKWLDLGRALAASFGTGEASLWTGDPTTQDLVTALGWSDAFPSTVGDFYRDAEFEYLAKNGSALLRTFDHVVTLHADGSGLSSTTMVLRDTAPAEAGYNDDSLSYITPYGPRFSTLDPSSDKPDATEASLAGHPTVGYLRAAQPLGSMTLHVAFQSQILARPRTDGSLLYTLDFLSQRGHIGDILHITVHLPHGWHWAGKPPPSRVALTGAYRGAWAIRHN